MWPMVAVFGFLGLTGLVVALGATATARYEFERNGARELQRRSSSARTSPAHPAGSRLAEAETPPPPPAVRGALRPVAAAGGRPPPAAAGGGRRRPPGAGGGRRAGDRVVAGDRDLPAGARRSLPRPD